MAGAVEFALEAYCGSIAKKSFRDPQEGPPNNRPLAPRGRSWCESFSGQRCYECLL